MASQPSGSPALFSFASNTGTAVAAIGDLTWTQSADSTIAISATTSFTLTPGHLYLLEADFGGNTFAAITDDMTIQWVDSANAVLAGSDGGAALVPMASADLVSNKSNTKVIVNRLSASTNLVVKLRATTVNGVTTVVLGTCVIRQIL